MEYSTAFQVCPFDTLMHHKEPVGEFGIIVWPASLFFTFILGLSGFNCVEFFVVFVVIYSPNFTRSRVWLALMASAGSLCLSP